MYNKYTIKEYLYKIEINNWLFTTKKEVARVGLSVKISQMNIHVPIRKKNRTFVLGSYTVKEHNREKHPEAKYGIIIDFCVFFIGYLTSSTTDIKKRQG